MVYYPPSCSNPNRPFPRLCKARKRPPSLGVTTVTNGLRVEQKFLGLLEQLGFRLRRADTDLDERDKIDAIVESPPLLPGAHFFPPAVALQITLRREDLNKRRMFVARARSVAPRLAYLELMVDEVTPAVAHAAAAALTAMFYDEGPRYRLLVVGENVFETFDLEAEDNQHDRWLRTGIEGQLTGHVIRWEAEKGYGFIKARVKSGPNGSPTEMQFFFNDRVIKDPTLRDRLDRVQNWRTQSRRLIHVVFTDGGVTGDQRNKNAHNVRLAPAS